MAKEKPSKNTGMGASAFFQSPSPHTAASEEPDVTPISQEIAPATDIQDTEKAERRSFNLKPSTLRLLDEIQIKTIRDGQKWTLSAIVERGIALVAEEMDVDEIS